jgi:FAD-dependent oxidoreductase domain-containing protein 1
LAAEGAGSDVVIVGAGAMGASAAFWLTRLAPGLSVRVLEADPSYARAATALSVASIRQQFSTPANVAVSRFGIDFIRNFARWTGLPPGQADLGLRENGYLFLAASREARGVMEDLAAMQRAAGAATEVLSPAEIAARFPWMETDDLSAASFGPRDEGWFDNMGLLGGLRSAARAQGARFDRGRVVAVDVRGGAAVGVTLEDGTRIAADAVVLAAGTRVNALLGPLGLGVPVEPRKRTVFVIDAPDARHPDAPLVIDYRGVYMRPERGHWIAATVPDDDGPCASDDFEPDLDQFEELVWPRLFARAAGFAAVRPVRHWVGHYDFNSFDQNAILGRHSALAGLYLMTGFSGHGLQQSPALGRGIAELIVSGGWQSLDLSDFRVERIAEGRPLREVAVV